MSPAAAAPAGVTVHVGAAEIRVAPGFDPQLLQAVVRAGDILNGWDGRPVYWAGGATDLRKSIDGLAALVQLTVQRDPCSSALLVFCNRGRPKLKILEWDTNGLWLHDQRLERGHFPWPAAGAPGTRAIAARQLQWLLDGLAWDLPQAHRPVRGRQVV